MDAYILDEDFQEIGIYDEFRTLIWTERYAEAGEVVFEVDESPATRMVVKEGNFVKIRESQEVAQIDTCEIVDGVLSAKGSMITEFLKNRMVKKSWDNHFGTTVFIDDPTNIPSRLVANFAAPGTPGGIMETGDVLGTAGVDEIIPNLIVAAPDIQDLSIYPSSVGIAFPNGTLYDSVKSASDPYALGFRLYLRDVTPSSYSLIFQTYAGKNRTSYQTLNPVVRFQSALDALTGVHELRSIKEYKNVAWAFATSIQATSPYVGFAAVDGGETAVGFKRRTMAVFVDDIQTDDVDLTTTAGQDAFQALLDQKAADALANNNYVRMVDGEIVPQSAYSYGVDYDLGDIIELEATSGASSIARITEYIRSQDSNGFSAYPTLSVIL